MFLEPSGSHLMTATESLTTKILMLQWRTLALDQQKPEFNKEHDVTFI